MKNLIKVIWNKISKKEPLNSIEYWEQRAIRLGRDAVLNVNNIGGDVSALKEMQIKEIFPHIQKELKGTELIAVDFGCGSGRFSLELAQLIKGKVIGLDPTASLLAHAPVSKNVEYKLLKDTSLPLADASVDLLFICLVLGCIKNDEVYLLSKEFNRVLKTGGLICLIENTAVEIDLTFFSFRSVEEYISFFPFANLQNVNEYIDCGQSISILIGEKEK